MIPINKVHRLDEATVNKIAAGEIIERPASVVKELLENAIDAGATRIEIEIKNGGRQLIQVTDNGSGMEREDAILALERHTTSKLATADDLYQLTSLGFRGEALPSIAAVSYLNLITRTATSDRGTLIEIKGGYLQKAKDVGAPVGTTVKVEDLFHNTPARLKYLKTIPTETSYISEIVSRLALGYPEISFRLTHHECELLFTPGNGNLYDTIVSLFDKSIAREMIAFNSNGESPLKLSGYIGKPAIARNNRSYEIFFINRRYFQSRIVSAAVEKAFHSLLPIARFPLVVLFLELDLTSVDINAHPTKLEVRFSNDSAIFKNVYLSVLKVLKDNSLISNWITPDDDLSLAQVTDANKRKLVAANLNLGYTSFETTRQQTAAVQENPAESVYTSDSPVVKDPSGDREVYVFPKAIQNTYIITQDNQGLLFVDQHAAHERILFEKYFLRTKEFLGTQALLIPETVNLNLNQYRVISERMLLFKELGYELEAFGGQTVIIRGVPLSLVNCNYTEIITGLADEFLSFGTFKNPEEIKEAFIITMACRTAVKAGDSLDLLEMEGLIKDLFRCENPYTCPHGRPTVFRLSTEELAKKFLRR